MYNLQKTIRYGFWLILEVIALCVGMIYNARTVRAEPEVQQPARKVTEVVTEKWTVISGKRLDLILKYMGDINFERNQSSYPCFCGTKLEGSREWYNTGTGTKGFQSFI